MIKSFRHAGLEKFFKTGNKAGIQHRHAMKLEEQLTALNRAKSADDMARPVSWRLHPLQGKKKHWSIWVNGNWRVTFTFDGEDAVLVDYKDYH